MFYFLNLLTIFEFSSTLSKDKYEDTLCDVHFFHAIDYAYICIIFLIALSRDRFLNDSQVRRFIHIHKHTPIYIMLLLLYVCV